MIDTLKEHVWDACDSELQELIRLGYEIVYRDVNLSAIYEELSNGFHDYEMRQQIQDIFGYYGLGALLKIDGVYYWLMRS